MASEEMDEPIYGDNPAAKYVVAFDPLGKK